MPATKVAGCLLDRVELKPVEQAKAPRIRPAAPEVASALDARDKQHPVEVGKVSYAADVAAIIQNKCQTCHRPGQVGPFSLLSYDDARKHSAMIREVVDDRRMPPWHADPRYGHFVNDRSLSAKERATLLAWVDQGTPLGDPKDLPPPRTFSEGWTIGKPDVVFELPETYYVPAQGVVSYVYFRVPTNFKEDMWVQAAEAVPGDRSVVHHIIVYVMIQGTAARRASRGRCTSPATRRAMCPRSFPREPPRGFRPAPTSCSRSTTRRSAGSGPTAPRSGWSSPRPSRPRGVHDRHRQPRPADPGRADNVAVASSLVLSTDARLVSFLPHMHLRGKDFKFTITRPGESPQVVLSVPAYDFGWQTYYILAEPMKLPKGTRIDCLAHFDNSESNPYNPDPNKLVRWGEQTFEEMMIGYLDMDVPVGDAGLAGHGLRADSEKATMVTIPGNPPAYWR